MFENVATRTARTLYILALGLGVIALAWLCLVNLPLWVGVLAFCLGLPVLALIAGPLAAAGALLAGVVAGLVALIAGSTARRVRHGG